MFSFENEFIIYSHQQMHKRFWIPVF